MRISVNRLWLLLPLFMLLVSCGGSIESINFESPEGDRSIGIEGKRESMAGPIIVTVTLKVKAGTKSFSFEHQAASMTRENVTANWLNNERCDLTFKLDDGSAWQVETFLLDDRVEAIKKFEVDGKSIFH